MTSTKKQPVVIAVERTVGHKGGLLSTIILGCFFLSGMTGLIYQILWTRMIVKIIGNAPFAVSIVLTVFMMGLGLGSYLAGRVIDRIQNPPMLVRVYGILELIIAAYGLFLPVLLILFRPMCVVFYNHLFQYFLGYNVLTFIACSFLMLIPVICMGATLPVLGRFFVIRLSHVGTRVGRLYGLNTIGAACGSILCGFLLIRNFGIWGTTGIAAAVNMGIGLVCILASHRLSSKGYRPESGSGANDSGAEAESIHDMSQATDRFHLHALIIVAVSGFCTMAYEVIWTKLLGLIVGPTTYSFTIVLTTFIVGLAMGSFFFGRISDYIKKTDLTLVLILTQVLAALSALAVSQILGNSQIFFAKLIYDFKDHFTQLLLLKGVILFLFMIIPTFFLGAAFPLTIKICARSLRYTGRSIGSIYAINTVGAVAGSFFAGFILIPMIGKESALGLVIFVQLFSALLAGGHIRWQLRERRIQWTLLILPVLFGLILTAYFPHWNRNMLASGKYHRFQKFSEKQVGWVEALFSGMEIFAEFETDELVFFGDGIGGFTTVWQSGPNVLGHTDYIMLNNGKADATTSIDMCTQTVSAHFPLIFHPDPKKVLVVGLGSGITAGEVLHYPVDRLDVVEINEQVVAASRFFTPWNNHVLSHPKTNLIVQDGRAHLELSDRTYDVIISVPSNPWMAGIAALYTQEYMQLAKKRLNKGGINVQWIHSYQMDWPTFALVGRTFSSVFPNSLLISTNPGRIGPDFLLVGFKDETIMDIDVAAKNFTYSKKSKNIILSNHSLFINLIISEDLRRFFGDGLINTDNRPRLEFAAPELMHVDIGESKIEEKLQSKSWLSKRSMEIIQSYLIDIEKQIDLAAFTLSFHEYEKNQIDLTRASPDQRERLAGVLENYCAEYIVSDFSFINDGDLKQRCIRAGLDAVAKNLATEKQNADIYSYMGWLYYENKDPVKAADCFFRALHIKPQDKTLNLTLKQILTSFSIEDAAEKVRHQLKVGPENYALYYQMGIINENREDPYEALNNYQKALSIRPDFVPALNNLAFIYMRNKNYSKSVSLFKKIIDVQPDYFSAYYNIACLFAVQNKSEEALVWFEEALKKGFNNWKHIMSDTDIANIRDSNRFKQLKKKYAD
ncbi:MAG: fused MFS/spermidine synthase [Deltaproteobacteria bacterium]|nr:fused MFS/spermidine synthase [Deltaproteobacteria bacterium]